MVQQSVKSDRSLAASANGLASLDCFTGNVVCLSLSQPSVDLDLSPYVHTHNLASPAYPFHRKHGVSLQSTSFSYTTAHTPFPVNSENTPQSLSLRRAIRYLLDDGVARSRGSGGDTTQTALLPR